MSGRKLGPKPTETRPPWQVPARRTSLKVDEILRYFLHFAISGNLKLSIDDGTLSVNGGKSSCLIKREGSTFKLDLDEYKLAINIEVAAEPLYQIIRGLGRGCSQNRESALTLISFFGPHLVGNAYSGSGAAPASTGSKSKRGAAQNLATRRLEA